MKLFLQKKCKIFERWWLRPQTPKTAPPLRISGYAPVRNNFVLKHHRPKNMQRPKKSLKLFLRRYQNLIDWCIFILLSRESDGALCFGRIRTRLGVDHFPSFPVDVLSSSHVNLLLVQSHQAEIIIVKRLIQGRNNVTRVRVELMILRSESS